MTANMPLTDAIIEAALARCAARDRQRRPAGPDHGRCRTTSQSRPPLVARLGWLTWPAPSLRLAWVVAIAGLLLALLGGSLLVGSQIRGVTAAPTGGLPAAPPSRARPDGCRDASAGEPDDRRDRSGRDRDGVGSGGSPLRSQRHPHPRRPRPDRPLRSRSDLDGRRRRRLRELRFHGSRSWGRRMAGAVGGVRRSCVAMVRRRALPGRRARVSGGRASGRPGPTRRGARRVAVVGRGHTACSTGTGHPGRPPRKGHRSPAWRRSRSIGAERSGSAATATTPRGRAAGSRASTAPAGRRSQTWRRRAGSARLPTAPSGSPTKANSRATTGRHGRGWAATCRLALQGPCPDLQLVSGRDRLGDAVRLLLPPTTLSGATTARAWVGYTSAGLPPRSITCKPIVPTAHGVHVGTGDGLYRLAGDRWERAWPQP